MYLSEDNNNGFCDPRFLGADADVVLWCWCRRAMHRYSSLCLMISDFMLECMPISLHERSKAACKPSDKRPRRYCQRRLVDSQYEDRIRGHTPVERFWLDSRRQSISTETVDIDTSEEYEDIYLTVQNLKFSGVEKETVRPKTCFQYKSLSDQVKHRMFVKEPVHESYDIEDGCYSPSTCYYIEDLANYIKITDRSQTVSIISDRTLHNNASQCKETKEKTSKPREKNCCYTKPDTTIHTSTSKNQVKPEIPLIRNNTMSRKKDKVKPLVTRTQSPETVQVIRVEILCNENSSSALSDCGDEDISKIDTKLPIGKDKVDGTAKSTGLLNQKYFLLNNMKHQENRLSRGKDQVSFMCKSFKLSQRSTVEANFKATTEK